jgi:molybdate transport system substrate-binding protein
LISRIGAAFLATFVTCTTASAAEIKVISSVGMKAALEQIQPQFERATPHKLVITLGTAVPLKRQIDGGEAFDVAILTPPMIEDLAKQGKVVPTTVANVARTGVGVAVRKGTAKPDIGSSDAMKSTLLKSKAIAYSKEGQSGTAAARMIEHLGIGEEMKPRTHVDARPGGAVTAVVEGKAELAFALVSEIVPITEVDFVGPLPVELQTYVVFAAGASSAAKDAEAAKAFIDFLRGPAVLPILKAQGMEGGSSD